MAIESNQKIYPVSWIVDNYKSDKINPSIAIQRREVWDDTYKSNLIVAILCGVAVANLSYEKDGKCFNIIDGKQRTITLWAFITDDFAISPRVHLKEIDGFEIVGKKFSEFPEELQNRILNYQMPISIYNKMTEDERDLVFFMGNQAVPLSKMDLTPVMLGEAAMNTLGDICKHPFMSENVNLTKPAIRKRDNIKAILHYMILSSDKNMGFSGKEILSFCDDIKHGEQTIKIDEIATLMDYLREALDGKRTYLKKIVHIPVIMCVAEKAKDKKLGASEFGKKLDGFFEAVPEAYADACQSGSAKRTNVQIRLNIMSEALGV